MTKIPNFTKMLKEDLIHILNEAEVNLLAAIDVLKEKCLVMENKIQPSQALIELASINLLKMEYRPSLTWDYVNEDDYEQEENSE